MIYGRLWESSFSFDTRSRSLRHLPVPDTPIRILVPPLPCQLLVRFVLLHCADWIIAIMHNRTTTLHVLRTNTKTNPLHNKHTTLLTPKHGVDPLLLAQPGHWEWSKIPARSAPRVRSVIYLCYLHGPCRQKNGKDVGWPPRSLRTHTRAGYRTAHEVRARTVRPSVHEHQPQLMADDTSAARRSQTDARQKHHVLRSADAARPDAPKY